MLQTFVSHSPPVIHQYLCVESIWVKNLWCGHSYVFAELPKSYLELPQATLLLGRRITPVSACMAPSTLEAKAFYLPTQLKSSNACRRFLGCTTWCMQSKEPAAHAEPLSSLMANPSVISHPSHTEVQSVLSRGTRYLAASCCATIVNIQLGCLSCMASVMCGKHSGCLWLR